MKGTTEKGYPNDRFGLNDSALDKKCYLCKESKRNNEMNARRFFMAALTLMAVPADGSVVKLAK